MSEVLRDIQPRLASAPAAATPGLHEPSTRSGTSLSEIETDLAKHAMDAADGNLTSSSAWQHPGNHVSAMIALGNWSTCQKLQRVLTRERAKTRFAQFWDSLADRPGLSASQKLRQSHIRVRFRKVLNRGTLLSPCSPHRGS